MAIKSKKWKPISTVYQTDSYLMTPNCYHKILSSCNSIRSSHVKSVSRTASCQNLWVCRHWGDFVTGRRPARKAECDWVSWAALELKQLTSRRSHVMWARGVPLTIPLLPAFRAILKLSFVIIIRVSIIGRFMQVAAAGNADVCVTLVRFIGLPQKF